MKLEVNGSYPQYICSEKFGVDYYYLNKDGTLQTNCINGWFNTKKEAEEFLTSWLPVGKWLCKESINWAASWTNKMAHLYSIEHWKQIVLVGPEGFKVARGQKLVSNHTGHCALCKRHCNNGTTCTLKNKTCTGWCVPEYSEASDNLDDNKIDGAIKLLNKLITTYNEQFGEKKMNYDERIKQVDIDMKALETEKQKLLDEKKKSETYIFKAGDIASKNGEKRIIVKHNSKLQAMNKYGNVEYAVGQKEFEFFNYKKIGELKDIL